MNNICTCEHNENEHIANVGCMHYIENHDGDGRIENCQCVEYETNE